MRSAITRFLFLLVLALPSMAKGQAVSLGDEYQKKIKAATEVAALGNGMFGNQTSDATGKTVFTAVDIDLPGNNALPVRFGRRLPIEPRYIQEELGGLGNWDIDVPYIEGTFSTVYGWSVAASDSPDRYKRCSIAASPKVEGIIFSPEEVFHGYRMHIPGIVDDLMMKHANNHANPIDGNVYRWIVGNSGRVSCLPTIKNGQPGEGFLVHLDDGTRYYFDYPVERFAPTLRKGPKYVQGYSMPRKRIFMLATRVEDRFGNFVDFQYAAGILASVTASDGRQIAIQPTSSGYVATANGRQWQYHLENGHLINVISPDASVWTYSPFGTYSPRLEYDGESAALEFFSPSDQCLAVPQFSDYLGGATFVATHPSGSRGEFGFTGKVFSRSRVPYRCAVDFFDHEVRLNSWLLPPQQNNEFTLRVAIREYVKCMNDAGPNPSDSQSAACVSEFMATVQTDVQTAPEPDEQTAGISGFAHMLELNVYPVLSLSALTISGDGIASQTTQYSYLIENYQYCDLFDHQTGLAVGPTCAQDPCFDGSCLDSVGRWTEVILPSGGKIRRRYGVVYGVNEGMLLEEQMVSAQGVTMRHVRHRYLDGASSPTQNFNRRLGWPLTTDPIQGLLIPLVSTEINESDRIFLNEVPVCSNADTYCLDAFARPTKVRKSNTLGALSTDVHEYQDDLTRWVLGQPKRTTNVETGAVVSEVGYNTLAQPIWTKKFGKLQQTLTYNTDGTLATVADGRGNVTSLSNWKRGIPQLIRHPATPEAPSGATESATVNDNGWITSVTDENGYVTGYGYDPMGRLASIVQPTGDSVTYHNTLMNFRALTDADWKPPGVASGQWRLYEETGSRATITYMDALWRPVLKHEYDATNVGPTLRAVKTGYDTSGRVSFQSYPSSDMIPGASGIRTFYDALDRVTRVEQDSELGVLATTTEYLSGLKTRVINPRGFQTTTSFMAWDQPGYDLPILSEQPEGKVIEIARHPQFGWPQQLKQRNTAGTLQQSRQYVYDTYGQLCKTIEPETGATVMDYDAAGNLSWSAAGLTGVTYAGLNDCSQAAAGGSGRVTHRAYDARNRLTNLAFPNGRGNQVWSYTPDGLPASITTYNESGTATPVVNGYSYNRRRLMTGESIYQAGWYNWATGYGYDAYGHLSLQTYHTGLNVDYAPNVYGQPTKAGTFASGVQYYPNGALKQFTYGNGIVHTMTQNARQLPVRVTATGNAMDYDYAYDPNGNVERIYDYVTGTPTPRHRWMGYDGLDRLTSTASAVFGGTDNTHRFTYDALDNMTSWKLAGVKDYADYVYDASTHRLTNIRNTAGATVVGMDYDEQGNLRNKNGQAYEFDYGNRLRNVPGKESYRYDGHGRRVLSLRPDGSNILSMYGFNGQVVLQDHGTKVEEHIYLAGSIVATRVKTWATGGTYSTRYQHTDALGSPVAVSNEAGQVIERNDYEPYGAIIGKPTFSGIGYTGHVMDGATGLTYMQQRYYDQSVGRFLSVDPVTADSATGANFNRYSYAFNNPYKFVDPDGRQSREVESVKNYIVNTYDAIKSDFVEVFSAATDPAMDGTLPPGPTLSLFVALSPFVELRAEAMGAAARPAGPPGLPSRAGFRSSRAAPAEPPFPPYLYRAGGSNPGAFKPRPQDKGMLSTRDSLSNPWPLEPGELPVFPAGRPIQVIDTSRLPPGSVVVDGAPYGPAAPGHVSIGPNVDKQVVKNAVIRTIPAAD